MARGFNLVQKNDDIWMLELWNTHWYQVPGIEDKLKSVSLVLSVINKGYYYDDWLKNNGRNADYILKAAQESGTRLHNAFEQMIKGNMISQQDIILGDIEFDPIEWEKIYNWKNWYEKLAIAPIAVETTIYHPELLVAGTADLICMYKGQVWLLDWKTGNNIYETSKLQIAAYANFWNHLVDIGFFNYPKIERCGLVHVGASNRTFKDMNGPGVKVEEADMISDFEDFKLSLKLFNRFNPNCKAPDKKFPLELKLDSGILKVKDGE